MARLLFSSEMRMWPLGRSSAAFGLFNWLRAMPTTPFCPYCHTMALLDRWTSMIRSLPWSVMSTLPFGRNVFWTGVFNWLAPKPVTPNWPYCQTMLPPWSTSRTRLSTQPALQFGVAPGGTPVPDISVRLPTRSASLVPAIALAEVSPGPFPNCQTMLPEGEISMTRLLNWSVIRIFPGWLKVPLVIIGALVANTDGNAASARNTTAIARKVFFHCKRMFSCPPFYSKVLSESYYHNSLLTRRNALVISSRLQTYSGPWAQIAEPENRR